MIVAAYFDRLVRSLRVQDELVSRVERAGGPGARRRRRPGHERLGRAMALRDDARRGSGVPAQDSGGALRGGPGASGRPWRCARHQGSARLSARRGRGARPGPGQRRRSSARRSSCGSAVRSDPADPRAARRRGLLRRDPAHAQQPRLPRRDPLRQAREPRRPCSRSSTATSGSAPSGCTFPAAGKPKSTGCWLGSAFFAAAAATRGWASAHVHNGTVPVYRCPPTSGDCQRSGHDQRRDGRGDRRRRRPGPDRRRRGPGVGRGRSPGSRARARDAPRRTRRRDPHARRLQRRTGDDRDDRQAARGAGRGARSGGSTRRRVGASNGCAAPRTGTS